MATAEKDIDWQDAADTLLPHIVKISTPAGWGTGFLIATSDVQDFVGIATAAHVVDHAHAWLEPIRIEHVASGRTKLLRAEDRAVLIAEHQDTAAIVFSKGDLPLPNRACMLAPKDKYIRVGNHVGWLGFPAIAPSKICFFRGAVSAFDDVRKEYLIDGVAINGVSGGPTFFIGGSLVVIVGAVSAYSYNQTTNGAALPGLCIVTDVSHFQEVIAELKSIDDARKMQTPPGNTAAAQAQKGV